MGRTSLQPIKHLYENYLISWALVAHACNPSYLRGSDLEYYSWKTTWAIVCETLFQKNQYKTVLA
jgi:hypothetical protein